MVFCGASATFLVDGFSVVGSLLIPIANLA